MVATASLTSSPASPAAIGSPSRRTRSERSRSAEHEHEEDPTGLEGRRDPGARGRRSAGARRSARRILSAAAAPPKRAQSLRTESMSPDRWPDRDHEPRAYPGTRLRSRENPRRWIRPPPAPVTSTPTRSSSAPGSPGWSRPASWRRRGARSSSSRPAERVGGRAAERADRRRRGRRARRASGSAPPRTASLALCAELGLETFPTYDEGESVLELGGSTRRYSGTIPRVGPLRPRRHRPRAVPARAADAAGSRRGALGAPRRRPRRPHPRRLARERDADPAGAEDAARRRAHDLGRRARADLAPARALLRALGRRPRRRSSTSRAAPSRTGSWAARS